jgi:3-phosphoshikimate 1-carboxyvinyltransferase
MQLTVQPSRLQGAVDIPGSKSHTIRAVAIAALAEGTSVIEAPLVSADAEAAVRAYRALGARIEVGETWTVTGVGGQVATPDDVIDVGNSGATLYLALGAAALGSGQVVFTGDAQIRRRSAGPLLHALCDLGSRAFSTRENGCAPIVVGGPLRGGHTAIACPISPYLSSLLVACPLADGDTEIEVVQLTERPFAQMTLDWLDRQGICYEAEGLERFRIPGGQSYHAFERRIPADFSSAAFFLCAAAVGDSEVLVCGLDMADCQGDKAIVDMLRAMGADIAEESAGLRVRGRGLHGAELDLNATPDALPVLAVTGCLAEGETRLVNVPQARLKETDRITVMREELQKLGGEVTELPDGLVIQGGALHGGPVEGHGDHRVVMALAVAGLYAQAPLTISTAEAVSVTFPGFVELMTSLGAEMATE